MTRYLVTDTDLRSAINAAISEQNKNPQDDNHVIAYSMNAVNHILHLSDKSKVAETKPTEKPKQNTRREIDTSEHPFIRLEANELVGIICNAYSNGLTDKEQS